MSICDEKYFFSTREFDTDPAPQNITKTLNITIDKRQQYQKLSFDGKILFIFLLLTASLPLTTSMFYNICIGNLHWSGIGTGLLFIWMLLGLVGLCVITFTIVEIFYNTYMHHQCSKNIQQLKIQLDQYNSTVLIWAKISEHLQEKKEHLKRVKFLSQILFPFGIVFYCLSDPLHCQMQILHGQPYSFSFTRSLVPRLIGTGVFLFVVLVSYFYSSRQISRIEKKLTIVNQTSTEHNKKDQFLALEYGGNWNSNTPTGPNDPTAIQLDTITH